MPVRLAATLVPSSAAGRPVATGAVAAGASGCTSLLSATVVGADGDGLPSPVRPKIWAGLRCATVRFALPGAPHARPVLAPGPAEMRFRWQSPLPQRPWKMCPYTKPLSASAQSGHPENKRTCGASATCLASLRSTSTGENNNGCSPVGAKRAGQGMKGEQHGRMSFKSGEQTPTHAARWQTKALHPRE